MPKYSVPAPRRRGRPKGGSGDTRAQILAAAVEEFGEKGYDGATMRAIAGRAGVDPSLLHHYFGTKADLFGSIVDTPLRPDLDIPGILAGPRTEVGHRIVRYVLTAWDDPNTRKRGVALLRSALGNRLTTPLLAEFLRRELLGRIAAHLDTPDADLRAALAATQIAGLLLGRYVLQFPALRDADIDDLVERVGPTVQRYLVDD